MNKIILLTNKFKNLSTNNKVAVVLLISIGIYLALIALNGFLQGQQLKKNGVYFAAKIYNIESSKSGPHYYIEYHVKGKRYTGGFLPDFQYKPNRKGAYIFIKILPDRPEVYQYLENGEVTDSLLRTMPNTGWRSLPDVPKQYLVDGNYVEIH